MDWFEVACISLHRFGRLDRSWNGLELVWIGSSLVREGFNRLGLICHVSIGLGDCGHWFGLVSCGLIWIGFGLVRIGLDLFEIDFGSLGFRHQKPFFSSRNRELDQAIWRFTDQTTRTRTIMVRSQKWDQALRPKKKDPPFAIISQKRASDAGGPTKPIRTRGNEVARNTRILFQRKFEKRLWFCEKKISEFLKSSPSRVTLRNSQTKRQ